MKKLFCLLACTAALITGSAAHAAETEQIRVEGNRLVYNDSGEQVTLRGVNVPSLSWGMAEHVYESAIEMFDAWNSNIIRVAVQPKYWNNGSKAEFEAEGKGGGLTVEQYREYVDNLIKLAEARGKYVLLDCHTYVMPVQETYDFWIEMADRYGNNPAVLFGLLNEPHDIKPAGDDAGRDTWDVWRNGGYILKDGIEVYAYGHQELVEAIRDRNAKNILVAGGQNWAYDISGIANGYALVDCGSGGDVSKSGYGIMYDTHMYPGKGNRDSWNWFVGRVREMAPVIVGEWGWDSSNRTVTGDSTSTSQIWMRQLIKWMDDGYNEYDGTPTNYTAWNLHMKSTPTMILDWSFKTTAFNGKYIKEDLLSREPTASAEDGSYINDFTPDLFRAYGTSNAENAVKDGSLKMTYREDYSNLMYLPVTWDLNGIQTLSFDITGNIGETVNVGFYCTDQEYWTKQIETDGTIQHISIGIDELHLEGNPSTDRLLKGLFAVVFKGKSAEGGAFTIDNVRLEKSKEAILKATAPEPETQEVMFDWDHIGFAKKSDYQGPVDTSYFHSSVEETMGVDGNPTKALKIEFNRRDGGWGGNTTLDFGSIRVPHDTKYFSICVKGTGSAQRLDLNIGGVSWQIWTQEGDTGWKQYILDFSESLAYPEDMSTVIINSGTKTEDSFYVDNISFTREYPERTAAYQYSEAKYGFEREWNYKREPQYRIIEGGEGDTISSKIVADGYKSPKAFFVDYTRGAGDAAMALVDYKSSSDFVKSHSSLISNMASGTNLVFYAKSLTGEQKINISLIDPVYETYTNEVTVTLSGTGYKKYVIPLDKFRLLDCGIPIAAYRIRGYRFSGAEANTSGKFVVDDLNITNKYTVEEIDTDSLIHVNDFDNDVYEENGGTWLGLISSGTGDAETALKAAGAETVQKINFSDLGFKTDTNMPGNYLYAEKIKNGGYKDSAALRLINHWGTSENTITMEGGIPEEWDMSKALYVGAMVKAESISYSAKRKPQTSRITVQFYNDDMLTGTAILDAPLGAWGWATGEVVLNSKVDNSEETIAGTNKIVLYMTDSQVSTVILDDLTFSYIPINRSTEIEAPVDYYETFEGTAMSFNNATLNVSNEEYFKVVDTKNCIGDVGNDIQYVLKKDYIMENAPYIYSGIPSSWGLHRATSLKFTAWLMTDPSVSWYWQSKNSVGYSDEYCNETLTLTLGLADQYGKEYHGEVTLDTSAQKEYRVPLANFVDENGNHPDMTKITQVRIYPDLSTKAAAFMLDNFGFITVDGEELLPYGAESGKDPVYTISDIVLSDRVIFTVNGDEITEDGNMFYVAGYNADNKFLGARMCAVKPGENAFDDVAGADYYKIFTWNNMSPKYDVITVKQ